MDPNQPNQTPESTPNVDQPPSPPPPIPESPTYQPSPAVTPQPTVNEPSPLPQSSQPPQIPGQPISAAPAVQSPNGYNPQSLGTSGQTSSLGLIGLILAVFLPLIGLIVSLVAHSKAKKAGVKDTLATIGIIVGGVMTVIGLLGFIFVVLGTFKGVQSGARDAERKIDITALSKSIESYFNTNRAFPASLDSLKSQPGFDEAALVGPDNKPYVYELKPAGCNPQVTCTGSKVSTIGELGQSISVENSLTR